MNKKRSERSAMIVKRPAALRTARGIHNQKPTRRLQNGIAPFVKLHGWKGALITMPMNFRAGVRARDRNPEQERGKGFRRMELVGTSEFLGLTKEEAAIVGLEAALARAVSEQSSGED
jgi:hypothetical protein